MRRAGNAGHIALQLRRRGATSSFSLRGVN
jgi:hypothetical protein